MYYNMQKETYEDKIMRELTDEKLSEIIKKTDNNTMIAHYTTMEGFVGLLNSVDVSNGEPMLKMWASNIFALNDPSEFMHGYKYTREWLSKIESQLNVSNENKLSRIWRQSPYAKKSNSYYNKLLKESLRYQDYNVFVLSFSQEIDNLAMLRLYSQDATGVCLVFSKGMINDIRRLHDVCYDNKTNNPLSLPTEIFDVVYKLYFEELKQQQHDNDAKFKLMLKYLTTYIMIAAPFIKRGDYAYEKEIRYSKLYKIDEKIKFRTNRNGNIIPYIEVEVPLKAIKKIIIGPCANFDASKYAIELKYRTMGISLPEIVRSKNSYRIY